MNSELWLRVRSNAVLTPILRELIGKGREEQGEPLPELSDAMYGDYAATGVRLRFEKVYFERRRRLARAAVALLVEGGDVWERSFLNKLEEIFGEESWGLPAHIHLPDWTAMPSGKSPTEIDLFAAETVNLMAECLVVFAPIMPETLQQRILERLRRDFFENYRDNAESYWWTTATSNWNAVCHQGILGAALQIEGDTQLVAEMLAVAARYLPHFLSGYGADGGCTEGPSYWEYGFGWFSLLNEQLEVRTGGELSLFANEEKITAIAKYGSSVTLSVCKLVNFADAAPEAILRPQLDDYLGARLDLSDCRNQALENYRQLMAHGCDYDANRADLLYWLRLLLQCPEKLSNSDLSEVKRDVYFPNLAVWIVRGRDTSGRFWEVAAKGGHNDEHHNHNDLGSFIVNVDGVRLISEIGQSEYTRDTFSDKRYTSLATRAMGHSLPVLNRQEQAAGSEYVAQIMHAETNADTVRFEVDLTRAYPDAARCQSLSRTLEFRKSSGQLTWSDEVTLKESGEVESGLITEGARVEIISPQLAHISKEGLVLAVTCDGGVAWNRIEVHPYRGHHGTDDKIERLVLTLDSSSVTRASFHVTITVARK